jgi:hypothetical protein
MTKRIITSILTVSFLFFGCKSNNIKSTEINKVNFKTVSKGVLYGVGSEGINKSQFVIKSKKDWNNLLQKINSANSIINNFSAMKIDFSKYILIAIFDKLRGRGGYEIEINNIEENSEEIFISIGHKQPKEISISVMTQPYHIVKMLRTDKKIIFR